MVLVQAGGTGWVHVGSLNGSEASVKINRELAVQVQSNAVYDYLAAAFWQDWLVGWRATFGFPCPRNAILPAKTPS